ncbi:hypothetical protein [Noviherbaspirillum saxi]|uniref:Lipoprotein n=1 Tax=Noviherbaspirillum saxi TaxID=2320863 RepID=A0A3A3FMV7_9BURK|nr:hypothetical protein [Noviherbaspirillum saxi]RJF97336.1 hypothetical protein D3871_01400 [Noviherbaspirillum saxi]
MKNFLLALLGGLLSTACLAQSAGKTEPTFPAPIDPGISIAPDKSMKAPSNSGIVVVPPKTDPGAVVTPPRHVDPKMDDATSDIDRKNAEESRNKKSK